MPATHIGGEPDPRHCGVRWGGSRIGDRILHRYGQYPSDLRASDPNLGPGAVNGGTAQLFQQLVFRPVPGLGQPETSIPGLYLGSAAAHPAAVCTESAGGWPHGPRCATTAFGSRPQRLLAGAAAALG